MFRDTFEEPSGQEPPRPQRAAVYRNPSLYIQHLEASLNMDHFMSCSQNLLGQDSSDSECGAAQRIDSGHRVFAVKPDYNRMMYESREPKLERQWLRDIVMDSDSDADISDEDEHVKQMLNEHVKEQKYRTQYYQNRRNAQYGYYGSGLISLHDLFHEHQRSIVGNKRPRKMPKKPIAAKVRKFTDKQQQKLLQQQQKHDARMAHAAAMAAHKERNRSQPIHSADAAASIDPAPQLQCGDYGAAGGPDETNGAGDLELSDLGIGALWKRGGARKKNSLIKTPEQMAALRRRVWQLMAKKELGKVQRLKSNNHKEALINYKRMATVCLKIGRQRAMQSQKTMRETVWRAKRLTREMQGYWKRFDRVERETKRRLEKEAEEQRKHDVEVNEVLRQQRKLNFLITQTELYAHFMSRKVGNGSDEEQMKILQQLDEDDSNGALNASADDYDCVNVKRTALKNASDAFLAERARTQQFNTMAQTASATGNNEMRDSDGDLCQPSIFNGSLKGYQIKGMTWLASLYDKGISGILADEMGLGKTVQSIAFLCHIAESSGVWGPFLVISPASTLHNWQQELQRFVPDFKVVPYWGAPQERKVLRQFWDTRNLHTREASFHVVITSYQLIVSDYKYFNRIKWQCMILDEAQAIKSASSVRWKLLLAFNCRNRLLLSGTPIQNSMAELWALLHFIMPTLFDSHDEFNEWFSKDIESHAENKTGIDEMQISRLHMILKPFMLRRIKKDVENELSDKIEIMVYCPLTTRQRKLYASLKRQIRIEDLLQYAGGDNDGLGDKNVTSNLMNLVMQFRKVCNHPELFERRDARSPLHMRPADCVLPRLLCDELLWEATRLKLLNNTFNIFRAEHIHRSLFPKDAEDYSTKGLNRIRSAYSFVRFCQLETNAVERISHSGLIYLLQSLICARQRFEDMSIKNRYAQIANDSSGYARKLCLLEPSIAYDIPTRMPPHLCFTTTTRSTESVYTFSTVRQHSMVETIEHRMIRSKHNNTAGPLIVEHQHKMHPPKLTHCVPITLPTFLFEVNTKISSNGRRLYVSSRSAQWRHIRHELLDTVEGQLLIAHGLDECYPRLGWSNIIVPDKQSLVSDAGKLQVLDGLLTRLKVQKHRVLIYSQMTKVIDLLEEYMRHKKHIYMRLDGSSKISARRDMVADFQNRTDIFVFLLSTRAGGLGINLTAADTVIFYDSDWNPTVDQQAMDRAHRLGQTKQVTVYRLICKGTIEERILQRARKKSEIQRMVISGGNFKPDTLKPKEVVSLLLDDEEIDIKYRQRNDANDPPPDDQQPCSSSSAIAAPRSDREKKRKSIKQPKNV